MLHVTEIEALIRQGYLSQDDSEDTWALEIAVHDLLNKTLIDSA